MKIEIGGFYYSLVEITGDGYAGNLVRFITNNIKPGYELERGDNSPESVTFLDEKGTRKIIEIPVESYCYGELYANPVSGDEFDVFVSGVLEFLNTYDEESLSTEKAIKYKGFIESDFSREEQFGMLLMRQAVEDSLKAIDDESSSYYKSSKKVSNILRKAIEEAK